jgi:diguanylate cyclase (GGDEF)-like protein
MREAEEQLKAHLKQLAEDYPGHPLLLELQSLGDRYLRLNRQLGKITKIGDRMQVQMRELNQALEQASLSDPLTGLPNRRSIMKRLKTEVSRVDRGGLPFALVMVDIDHFKSINDTYGHDVGDTAIVAVARTLRQITRDYDVCARWGGEEFLLFLPDSSPESAGATGEKLRRGVADVRIPHQNHQIGLTISLGIALHERHTSLDRCIQRADQSLYMAKRAGRNQCHMAAVAEDGG